MKETRQMNIKMKSFEKKDIINVAEVFQREAENSKSANNRYYITYDVESYGGVTVSSDHAELLNTNNGPLDIRKSKSISITFSEYQGVREMRFSITHGNDSWGNSFEVKGDKSWVRDIFTEVQELINAIKPQIKIAKYGTLLLVLLSLGLSRIPIVIVSALKKIPHLEIPWLQTLEDDVWAIGLGLYAIISICILIFSEKILGIWPTVEFDFGPEHLKFEKIRRKKMGWFLGFIILPIVLEIIFRLF